MPTTSGDASEDWPSGLKSWLQEFLSQAFLSVSWVRACSEFLFFIYHNTNFHWSFVINCMNVKNVEFWDGFCCWFYYHCYYYYFGFFQWIMKRCSGGVHSAYSKGLWYFPWGMQAFSRVCIKTALISFQNNFKSV